MNFSTNVHSMLSAQSAERIKVERVKNRKPDDCCAWRIDLGPEAYLFMDSEAFQVLRRKINGADSKEQGRAHPLCDVCQKEPSTRVIWAGGGETSVCDICSSEGYHNYLLGRCSWCSEPVWEDEPHQPGDDGEGVMHKGWCAERTASAAESSRSRPSQPEAASPVLGNFPTPADELSMAEHRAFNGEVDRDSD